MINSLLISQLAKTLKWLIWLLGLNTILLLIGLLCLTSWGRPVYSVEPQIIDSPIESINASGVLTPALLKGKQLFTDNCQQCHVVANYAVVGPGLLGVSTRVPDRAWLIKWIKNPSAVLKSGDIYANHMAKRFDPIVMPGFPTLKEDEVKLLIDYIDSYKSEETGFIQ